MSERPRCYYFQNGGCSKEEKCSFVHDMTVKARPPVCSNWENGHCRFENHCKFFHEAYQERDVRQSLPPSKTNDVSKGAASMNWRRDEPRMPSKNM